jgi:integrase
MVWLHGGCTVVARVICNHASEDIAMANRITKRTVDSLKPGQIVWDETMPGFGVRCLPSGRKSYVLKYRAGSGRRARQRWLTIGMHGAPWTPKAARREAARKLGEARLGNDPALRRDEERVAEIVSELCDQYLEAAESGKLLTRRGVPKKSSTLATDRGRIERHIKPLLGELRVRDLTRIDIEKFRNGVRSGKTAADIRTGPRGRAIVEGGAGTATRTLGLLGAIFAYAVQRGIRDDNPVHGVSRDAYQRRKRFLTSEEYKTLGDALSAYEAEAGPWPAVAAIRLIAWTGARKGEIEALRWPEIDLDRSVLRLADTKTGESLRPLSGPAVELLQSLPRLEGSDFVFPATKGNGHYQALPKVFRKMAVDAKLTDLTLHTLRHSFASLANELGYTEPTIAAMLGHSLSSTTSRYVHHLDSVLIAAAGRVGNDISRMMMSDMASGSADVVTMVGAGQS